MKQISFLVALFVSVFALNAGAQEKPGGPFMGKVKGTVKDESARIIETATITLIRNTDSTVTKMSVADRSGHYTIELVPAGSYMVMISAVGHQTAYSGPFEISPANPEVDVKAIELLPAVKTETGVTVVARRPLIEQKTDRTIVNVEAAVTNVGKSALEVLEKSPGITVDKDGNISLKGKSGVMVMIDGRPSYLSGQDLANMLRSMTASQLDQIEIMTNPPAKYDAAGNAGVINIKTKKNKQFGYSGSITTGYTQAFFPRFNEAASFNYRNGKINLFSNLSYNRNHRRESLSIYRNFRTSGTKEITSIFDQVSNMQNRSHYYSAKVGMDYTASKKTTIGFVLNGYYNPSTWESITNSDIYDPNKVLLSKTGAYSENKEKWKNYSGNINLTTVFDSTGQELSANVDYVQYRSTSNQPLISSYYNTSGQLTQTPDTLMGNLPQDITIYSAKADYTKPLKKGAKFEAGFKTSYVKTDNDANYDSLRNGQSYHDFNRSNHFVYEENINAAYVNYSRPLGKKWTGQFGLRVENTNAKGDQLTTGIRFSRHYTQLFPTAYLQYSANEKNQFVINYGRRINRPDYGDLNPFIHFLDRYTFEQGNPNLKPQFSHNIELSHTYKSFLTTTLNYSRTTDIIQQVIEQNELTNETFIKKANIASHEQVGLTVTAYKEIKKWWSGSVYMNFANNHFKGIVNNDRISISTATFIIQMQQQFKWGKGWAGEVSGFYRTKGVEGVIFIEPIKQFNAGLSKQILKNKATVKLNFNDIFRGSVFHGYSKYSNVDAQFTNVNDQRSISMGFTWRFNKGKLKANGSRQQGGAGDEQGRVKAGH